MTSAPRIFSSSPMQRADGAARIVFARREDGVSALADLYQRSPAKVLFPGGEDIPEAVLVTTSGGLTGGDRMQLAVAVQAGAEAVVTSQAAEKHYKSSDDTPTEMTQVFSVGAGATLEMLPQEQILFEGSRLKRRTDIHLTATSRLLMVDCLFFGRSAHGESVTMGMLNDRWQLYRDGRLLWADGLRLLGNIQETLAAQHGFGGAKALATLVMHGVEAEGARDRLRAVLAPALHSGTLGGVTALGSLVIARIAGPDAALVRAALVTMTEAARAELGRPARLPRVWAT
ncbi:urease accessory protein UreD [Lacibacterium aquatile]|uniref:Urease accessory protein UreD n=1 Tax=Lacibacterium aquatile TaxID=1168082 RepID=A0ABW5DTM0_9PROT